MRLNCTKWLVVLSFTSSLLACTDHRLGGPLSPAQLRLKSVQGGSLTTTYTYDSQNRLATITKASGNRLSIFVYDDLQQTASVNQYTDPADQTTGYAIKFPYNLSGIGSFVTRSYPIFNTTMLGPSVAFSESYSFDSNNHLTLVTRGTGDVGQSASSSRFYSYLTTGVNLTQGTFAQGHFVDGTIAYEYDTKVNPFYGLTDPDLDDTQRFSRNNIVKETPTGAQLGNQVSVYEYEYNAQNLPTKRTKKQSGSVVEVLTYSYESY